MPPEAIGPEALPRLIARNSIDIIEPIPNLLPSSTVKAEEAVEQIAEPTPWTSNMATSGQKLTARGITARNTVSRRLPRMVMFLLLNLSARIPTEGVNRVTARMLTDSSVPIRLVFRPSAAAKIGRKVPIPLKPRACASHSFVLFLY